MTDNRRKFSRISFQSKATLYLPEGECVVDVLDLSLKGALINPQATMFVTIGTNCTLKIRLDNVGTCIRMEATVVHHLANFYGLACRDIDLESVTHLRRLVALNLGDEALAEREFAMLSSNS